jgi:hypothetical protein
MKRRTKKQEQFAPAHATVRYKHEEAEKLISQTVPVINAEVVDDAKEMAESERPAIPEKGLGLYTENITRKHQVLLEQVNTLIGADSAKSEGVAFKKECERETKELEKGIHEGSHELRAERKILAEHNSTLGSDLSSWKNIFLGIIVVGITEWLINAAAFLPVTGGMWLTALGAGLGITLVTFLFIHGIDYFAKKVTPLWGKVSVVLLGSALAYTLFSAMANLRFTRLSPSGDDTLSEHVSKTDLILINFLIFFFCLILTLAFRPGKGVKEAHKAYCKQQQKVDDLEQSISQKKKRLSQLPKLRDEKLASLYGILVMAKNYEQLIESEHQQSLTLWVKTNLKHRTPDIEGRSPEMFREPRPTLTTYFHSI